MTRCVVDASMVAAAFFDEAHAPQARELLSSSTALLAPSLIAAEMINVIWKRYRRNEMDQDESRAMLHDFLQLPLRYTPMEELTEAGLELAMTTGRSAYDCLYLALAVRSGCAMVTADQRLVNALADTPLNAHLTWLGEVN